FEVWHPHAHLVGSASGRIPVEHELRGKLLNACWQLVIDLPRVIAAQPCLLDQQETCRAADRYGKDPENSQDRRPRIRYCEKSEGHKEKRREERTHQVDRRRQL